MHVKPNTLQFFGLKIWQNQKVVGNFRKNQFPMFSALLSSYLALDWPENVEMS